VSVSTTALGKKKKKEKKEEETDRSGSLSHDVVRDRVVRQHREQLTLGEDE